MTFERFFGSATGNTPYDYQSRLAGNDSGAACRSRLIKRKDEPSDLSIVAGRKTHRLTVAFWADAAVPEMILPIKADSMWCEKTGPHTSFGLSIRTSGMS